MTLSSDCSISLDNWRIAAKVSLREVTNDPTSLEACDCILDKSTTGITDLTDLTKDPDVVSVKSDTWLCNPLYTLTCNNRQEILSPDEWLSDSVIDASQKLMLQQLITCLGCKLQHLHTLAFQVHREEFVHIINIRHNHWCAVSNVGCSGVVNVYDSTYPSISRATIRVIQWRMQNLN